MTRIGKTEEQIDLAIELALQGKDVIFLGHNHEWARMLCRRVAEKLAAHSSSVDFEMSMHTGRCVLAVNDRGHAAEIVCRSWQIFTEKSHTFRQHFLVMDKHCEHHLRMHAAMIDRALGQALGSSVRRWVRCHYWSHDRPNYAPYCDVIFDSAGDGEVDGGGKVGQMPLLRELLDEAGLEDGDEFELVIRKTGRRPFGDRRVVWTRAHTYEREPEQ